MAGPVWFEGEDGPYTCDECLRTVDRAVLLGEVLRARFRVLRTLCDACYEESGGLIARAS